MSKPSQSKRPSRTRIATVRLAEPGELCLERGDLVRWNKTDVHAEGEVAGWLRVHGRLHQLTVENLDGAMVAPCQTTNRSRQSTHYGTALLTTRLGASPKGGPDCTCRWAGCAQCWPRPRSTATPMSVETFGSTVSRVVAVERVDLEVVEGLAAGDLRVGLEDRRRRPDRLRAVDVDAVGAGWCR